MEYGELCLFHVYNRNQKQPAVNQFQVSPVQKRTTSPDLEDTLGRGETNDCELDGEVGGASSGHVERVVRDDRQCPSDGGPPVSDADNVTSCSVADEGQSAPTDHGMYVFTLEC